MNGSKTLIVQPPPALQPLKLIQLPSEILLEVGALLSFQDRIALSVTNKALLYTEAIAEDNNYWQRHFAIHFPSSVKYFTDEFSPWNLFFKNYHFTTYKNLPKHLRKFYSQAKENRFYDFKSLSQSIKSKPSFLDFFTNGQQKTVRFASQMMDDLNRCDNQHSTLWDWIKKTKNQAWLDYIYQDIIRPFFLKNLTKVDTERRDTENRTILYYAVLCHQPLVEIERLLANGSQLNEMYIINFQEYQLLDVAVLVLRKLLTFKLVEEGRVDVLRQLIHSRTPQRALLFRRTNRNETHLMAAAASNQLSAAQFLLRHGAAAQINFRAHHYDEYEFNGYSALHWAVRNGAVDIVSLLCLYGANLWLPSYYCKMLPIHLAAQVGHLDVIKILLRFDPSLINATDIAQQTPLILAVKYGHIEIVKYLIDETHSVACNINKLTQTVHPSEFNHFSALHWAAYSAGGPLTEFLLPKLTQFLSSEAAAPPIHVAASQGNLAALQVIVRFHPELLNQRDHEGKTPLMRACQNGHAKIVKFLLGEPGIDINVQMQTPGKNFRHTALHWACENGHSKIVKKLLRANALVRTETHVPEGVPSVKPITHNKTSKEVQAWLRLAQYVENRPYQGLYKSCMTFNFSIFGYHYNFSETHKTPAALALKNFVFFKHPISLEMHKGALNNGDLNKIRKSLHVTC